MAARQLRSGRDVGLQIRMLLTMAPLGLLYVALVVVLLAAGVGTALMLVVVGGLALAQLFAIGRSPRGATLCATTGIIGLLEPHELEGVMAHELAHVKHRDVLIMTVASFFASVAAMVVQFGLLFGIGGRDREGAQPAFALVLVVSVVVYAVSFVLMLALSRYREFVADRAAAMTTGRPSALASALMKISGAMDAVPARDLRAAGQLNAFFIVPAGAQRTLRTLLSTHPPMQQRVAALARLEAELQHSRPVCR